MKSVSPCCRPLAAGAFNLPKLGRINNKMKNTNILHYAVVTVIAACTTTPKETPGVITPPRTEPVPEMIASTPPPPLPVPYIPPQTESIPDAPPIPEDEWMIMSAGPDGEYEQVPPTEFDLSQSTNIVRMRGVVWASPNLIVKTNSMRQ